ncbi:hypothetical protein A2U01_0112275, partial [Trifolium medium]|nr:hypothetical protein [Trifolium medium]
GRTSEHQRGQTDNFQVPGEEQRASSLSETSLAQREFISLAQRV